MAEPSDGDRRRLGLGDWLLAALFAATIAVMAAQVFCRYVLNDSLGWAEELSTYLFVWLIFIGAALAARDRAHVRVDVVVRLLPHGLQRWVRLAREVLLLAFFALLAFLGWRWVGTTARVSPALGLPESYAKYAALPLTFLVAAAYAVRDILRTIREWRDTPPDARGEE